ncbi:DUF6529 family protein [Pseudonocardia xishanensis]|uniref:Uncharacterized protein n=1 Tax=Pseudonocardia xishanensis TaxID=630995 RepID=A0ABP8RUK2_9PSEU
MPPSPYRVDPGPAVDHGDPVEPNPYDPPTHPALHPVTDPAAYDPAGSEPAAHPGVSPQVAYDPAYDPGAYVDPGDDPRTEVIPVVPAQPGPPEIDPVADPRVARAWAAQGDREDLWTHADRSGWDTGPAADDWDRPDYDDEFDAPVAPEAEQPAAPRRGRTAALLVPVVVGIALSVGLGVYARLHEGAGTAISIAGFSSGLAAKSWLTAAAFALVLVQLRTSMRMYGRLAKTRPAGPRTATLHRWSGRAAVLLTIPVAVHCLYALGYEDSSARVMIHSLFGCFFYGAFAAKMLLLPKRDAPRWALPLFGGLVFVLLTGLFLTSSVWFFSTKGLTF